MKAKYFSPLVALTLFGCSSGPLPVADKNTPVVGKISLVAFNGDSERVPGTVNLGHAFVVVENTSEKDISVGLYGLEPGEEVSIGSWSMSAHFGIWYNIETCYMDLYDRYEGRKSLTVDITEGDVTALGEYLADNDSWSLFRNCSYLALSLYNIACPESEKIDLKGTITPGRLYSYMGSTDKAMTDTEFADYGEIGYFEDGEFISFVPEA